ncbi:YgaP family membrane protein [Reichenbachiella ulvae]|uniref:DUF2892 domain-containing protein n=1 Tax=Reichenbachiella ulvae TaxID=2980104 RepID=A0ABT3CY04_9BACT|nr:DUF2892 domain-containing protein [Reichenbachiella ulvae]MCV9388414.1 DUF2892 domain-containing protein [Reichenbachiella ulvae]
MKSNMGTLDRVIRIVVALVLGILYYFGVISGIWATILIGLSVIFILTSLVSVCPLYLPFGISTCSKREKLSK